jgi:hypothetical protein
MLLDTFPLLTPLLLLLLPFSRKQLLLRLETPVQLAARMIFQPTQHRPQLPCPAHLLLQLALQRLLQNPSLSRCYTSTRVYVKIQAACAGVQGWV